MKKILVLILILSLAIPFAGCTGKKSDENNVKEPIVTAEGIFSIKAVYADPVAKDGSLLFAGTVNNIE